MSPNEMKYRAYLKSREWKHIRRNVLRRDKWTCQSCGERATEVHHLLYDEATLRGMNLDELMSLCRVCHEAVSLDRWGIRRPFREQRELSKELRASLRRKGQKAPKVPHYRVSSKLGIEGIRALSQEYAEGRMK